MTNKEAQIIMKHCRNFYNYSDIGEQIVTAFNMAIKALDQDQFISKPCVSSEGCEHDKNKVLEKIKADLEKLANDEWNTKVGSVSQGLECALEIIEAYQEGR